MYSLTVQTPLVASSVRVSQDMWEMVLLVKVCDV